jgi:MFS family permease
MGPFRSRTFRWLWIAQFVSNTGTWAQTVGAQWLMGDLGGGPLLVALVQTATSLPVFLLVLPSGALGRHLRPAPAAARRAGADAAGHRAAGGLTALDAVTPLVLLGLIGLVGAGQALALPSFQAIQPELVPRAQLPEAALLNGANFNVARALGPAIGGG